MKTLRNKVPCNHPGTPATRQAKARTLAKLSLALLLAGSTVQACADTTGAPQAGLTPVLEHVRGTATQMPRFMVDAAWPRMPATMLLGQVSGVAVDADDGVWIVHRPLSLGDTDTGLMKNPPTSVCCQPAPPVVHFDRDGNYVGGFDGASSAPTIGGVSQWPQSLHGISVDDKKTLWLAGNGKDDHVVLNYTMDGKFLGRIGQRGQTRGNADLTRLGNPSDVNRIGNRVYISDGYINRRLIGFEVGGDKAFGVWGAYGAAPAATTREGTFDQSHATQGAAADPHSRALGGIVHCSVPTGDGQIYLCDRTNNRAQLFDVAADGTLKFVRDLVIEASTGGLGSVTDIALSPDKKYLYVADMMNGRIWILLRQNHETLGYIGRIGRQAGQFTWLHSIATDSAGNLYATEVSTGRRVQKFVFTGVR